MDILYSNSVIQYLPNINLFANLIDRFKPKYVILDDVQISTKRDFFSLQRFYGSFIVSCFYNLNNLVASLGQYQYELFDVKNYPYVVSNKMAYRIEGRTFRDSNLANPLTLIFKLR